MTEESFKIGQTVQVLGKNLQGEVAYVGSTNFSPGKWIGLILSEEKGKNNGSVRGVSYFKCTPNCGLFVRPLQLVVVREGENALTRSSTSSSMLKTTKITQPKGAQQFLPSSSQVSLLKFESQLETSLSAPRPLAPQRSKTSVSPSHTFLNSKRSSFVETGFLEILQPQFTPGPPMRSPSFVSSPSCSSTEATSTGKLRDLEMKNLNLIEEIEELKTQKAEDKRALHELHHLKIQNEQLMEFKCKIMQQQTQLQRDLKRAGHETREALETMQAFKLQSEEMSYNLELITLDKEMAEERLETMQLELEMAQERLEELKLDLEILNVEQDNEKNSKHLPAATPFSSAEMLKLQHLNQRLKETIIHLRDALTMEKQNSQKLHKELQTKNSEIAELQCCKQTLSQQLDQVECQILDLKEQVDAALGAENMVTCLAQDKLEMEEKVKLLEDEMAELEALEEIQEQLIESNQELECDLRDEIDQLQSSMNKLQNTKEQALEALYDREVTILKFRELVKQLQAKLQESASLSEDLSNFSNEEDLHSISNFNQLFSETKAHIKAFDSQLLNMDLKLSKQMNEYLRAFVPESCMMRGGEYDIILVILNLHRLLEKIVIISMAVDDKFPGRCDYEKEACLYEGFSVQRCAFRSRCLFCLNHLKMLCQQMLHALDNGDYEMCQNSAIYRLEMEQQEKALDNVLQLLRNSQLDENSSHSLEELERCLGFFVSLFANLFGSHDSAHHLLNESQLYEGLVDSLNMGFDAVYTNSKFLLNLLPSEDESSSIYCGLQYLLRNMSCFRQKLKKFSRKLIDQNCKTQGDHMKSMQSFQECLNHLSRLINILSSCAKEANKSMGLDPIESPTVSQDKLWKMLSLQCTLRCSDCPQDPIQFMKFCTHLLDQLINDFSKHLQELEAAQTGNINTLVVQSSTSTLIQRAQQLRLDSQNKMQLKQLLADREQELKNLKYLARSKQDDYAELQIRKEMAERNLSKQLSEQQRFIGSFCNSLEKLQLSLTTQYAAFKFKLFGLEQKLQMLQNATGSFNTDLNSSLHIVNEKSLESHKEAEMLTMCLRWERKERLKLHVNKMKNQLENIEPLFVPQRTRRSEELDLEHKLRYLKNQWILSHININENSSIHNTSFKVNSEQLFREVEGIYLTNHAHRAVYCQFGQFFTKDVQQMLK